MTEAILVDIVGGDPMGVISLEGMLRARGFVVRTFESGAAWLRYAADSKPSCLIIDFDQNGSLTGLELLQQMAVESLVVPSIVLSADADIRTALTAVELGASDFLEKPVKSDELIRSIGVSIQKKSFELEIQTEVNQTERIYATLTDRERTILKMVCDGIANKVIARRLELGLRTIESCRAQLLKSFEVKTWPELIARAARFQAYRASRPRIMPPKFLSRRDYGGVGEIHESMQNTANPSHF